MTHGLRRVQPAGEMDILDRHVGGQDEFVPALDHHQRGIVANTEFQSFFEPSRPRSSMPVRMGRQCLEPLHEFVFSSKQVFTYSGPFTRIARTCFEEISKGPITEVSGGAKQFSLAIASKCP